MHFRRAVEELIYGGTDGCGKDAKTGWFRIWDRSRLLIQFAAELAAGHSGSPGAVCVVTAPGIAARIFAKSVSGFARLKIKLSGGNINGNEKVGEASQERREGKRQEDQGRKEHVDDGDKGDRHQVVVVEGQ
jgi:hypothetical protein